MKKFLYFLWLSTLLLISYNLYTTPPIAGPIISLSSYTGASHTGHIRYFGFTLVDTYWDDPSDREVKSNYLDEVKDFTNIADILVVEPELDIQNKIENMRKEGFTAILHLNEIFFEHTNSHAPSGANYDLRADYIDRWEKFIQTNNIEKYQKHLVFYIGEEPAWNGIKNHEIKQVAALTKKYFPNIPNMLIEAHPALKDLAISDNIDWIGFDYYFVRDPLSHKEFQEKWKQLLSLKQSWQKIALIMDTHYIKSAHQAMWGIVLDDMPDIAERYYVLAKSEPSVITVLGYFWPNWFDHPKAIGARWMPEKTQNTYKKIGTEIIAPSSEKS